MKFRKVKLGDVCKIVSGTTPSTNEASFWNGRIPWITPAEIHETSHVICKTERLITEKAVEKKALNLLPKGTVLLTSRAPIGKVAIAGIDMYCNQGFKNLICSDEIYNEYLYFFLKSKTSYLNYLGRGATFKEISKTIVENILIPLPSMTAQRQIAVRLDKVQELIALQKEQIKKADELVKSRFIEMFGDPVSNHKEWEIKTLKDLGDVMSGGTPSRSISKYFGGNINWFSAGELNYLFIDKSLETITEEGLLHSNAKLFPAGSLLIGMYDTAAFKLSILKQKAAFNQACAAISPKVVKVIWLYYVLSLLKHEALKFRRGVRQKNLNLQFIRDFKVPVPPLDLQKQFAEFVERIETQKALLEKRLNRLETLYKSLMQQYFG